MADGSSKMDMYPTLGNRTDAKEEASGRTRLRQEQPSAMSGCGVGEEDRISLAGPNPQFFIIMEYCEKGSLRQVLDSDYTLTWIRKADMCLDAARGLYRLHNTEEKWKVHGSINSSKFLVTKDYTVKLGGFRLPKTETSLKRQTEDRAMRSLCYYCPEKLHNASFSYCKEWEMYSFGIILWEIVTCKNPFEAFSDEEIYQKVCKEKYQEPLPDDCPAELGQLINECRAYDGFQRPSAGVLLDKLRSVVTQMEEQQD